MANKNSNDATAENQTKMKQHLSNIINDKSCFICSATFVDFSCGTGKQQLSIEYIMLPEDKTDSFEDAMMVVD